MSKVDAFNPLHPNITGREINFFSGSHLAPKFFKVVANSKKVGHHFLRQTKPIFMLSAYQIDPPKLSQERDC